MGKFQYNRKKKLIENGKKEDENNDELDNGKNYSVQYHTHQSVSIIFLYFILILIR